MTNARTAKSFLPALALGVLALSSCATEEPGALPEQLAPADVAVSDAATGAAPESFPAHLSAQVRARMATRTSGRIREIRADVGSAVRAGQPLVILDDGDVRARLEAAEAQSTLAERSFRRIENLATDGAASEQELDEARARFHSAEAAVRDARAQLEYVVVSAPFDGYVESRSAEPGDLAAPGRPLLTLVGRQGLQVEADLPADESGSVSPGDPVVVRVPSADFVAPARVTRVAPALEPGSRRLRVEAVFEPAVPAAGALVPGAYARLELAGAGDGSLWIPADAVFRRGQLSGVFAVSDDELRLRWLRLGRAVGDAMEVLAGPAGGLRVVRKPSPVLRDGQPTGEVEVRSWTVPEELRAHGGETVASNVADGRRAGSAEGGAR